MAAGAQRPAQHIFGDPCCPSAAPRKNTQGFGLPSGPVSWGRGAGQTGPVSGELFLLLGERCRTPLPCHFGVNGERWASEPQGAAVPP